MNKTLTIALLLAAGSHAAFAAPASLATPAVPDRITASVVAALLPAGNIEQAPVQFAWPLDPGRMVTATTPEAMESRSFWRTLEAAELQAGVELTLSAPGAVIQLSPAAGARPVPVEAMKVLSGGKPLPARRFETATLRDAGMAVAPGTAMLKLQDGNVGSYRLQAEGVSGRYVLQVLEPASPVVLRARTDRNVVLAGQSVDVQVHLDGAAAAAPDLAARLVRAPLLAEGLLVAPDGRTWPVPLRSDRSGGLAASVPVPAQGSDAPGLWELQVFAEQAGIARDTRVAFAVARPTARLAGEAQAANPADIRFPLQVGAAGRYEVRATLFATGADGQLRPVAQGHSAAWFNRAGRGELALSFAGVELPAGYGAPYELREVELHDQTRLAPIEYRARALRF